MSGFFSALIEFTKEIVNEELDIIDMAKKRFVIVRHENLLFVALVDSTEAVSSVRWNLTKLKDRFCEQFSDLLSCETIVDTKDFAGLGISKIFRTKVFFGEVKSLKDFEELLKSIEEMNEVKGCALLTETAAPIINKMDQKTLLSVVKHIEVHWEAGSHDFVKMIYYIEDQTVFLISYYQVILAILFRKGTPLGMAELIIDDISKKVENISYQLD